MWWKQPHVVAGRFHQISETPVRLVGRCFAANNIVSLDHCSNSDRFALIVFLFIDSNHAAMSPNEDFRSAGNFRRQSKREIHFSTGSEIFFHYEVNATS